MPVISNTSPLLNLAIVNQLSLIEEQFREIFIPNAVFRELDQGEAEAIALAIELKANLVLLDERDGRKIARSLGLNITGVLGIILREWHQGNLSSVKTIINKLRTEAHFRIAPHLEEQILKETGELNN